MRKARIAVGRMGRMLANMDDLEAVFGTTGAVPVW
jgi:hypothetical protein